MLFATARKLAPILSHMNPFHAFLSYFFKALFNIILLSSLDPPNIGFSPVSLPKPPHVFLFSHMYHMPPKLHPHRRDHCKVCWEVHIMSSSLCAFLRSSVTCPPLFQITSSALSSRTPSTLSLYSFRKFILLVYEGTKELGHHIHARPHRGIQNRSVHIYVEAGAVHHHYVWPLHDLPFGKRGEGDTYCSKWNGRSSTPCPW